MKRDLPAYTFRSGGRIYFRKDGRRGRLYADPGTPEFAAEYALLMRGRRQAPKRTIAGLIHAYRESDRWQELAPNTRKSYSRHFAYFQEKIGGKDPASLRPVHIHEMRDALRDTPTDASRKVGALKTLLSYAVQIGWLDRNPAHGVGSLKGKRPPRQPWPRDMIDAFRENADPDTRLIFEMLLGTGQRIGDVLRMQWGHIEGDGIRVKQSKTGAALYVPFTAPLRAAVATAPRRGLHIVTQANGRPVAYNTAWTWIMRVRREIGAEAWDIHSLRHAAASEIAALPGMSPEHVAAITGHAAVGMVRLYAGAAMQRARATEAQAARERATTSATPQKRDK